jgi:hypothetical protein
VRSLGSIFLAFHHRFSSLRAVVVPELCSPSPKTWVFPLHFFIVAAQVFAATFCQSFFLIGVNFCRWFSSLALESADQKARAFLVLVVLLWWVLYRAHQVFDEMYVRS